MRSSWLDSAHSWQSGPRALASLFGAFFTCTCWLEELDLIIFAAGINVVVQFKLRGADVSIELSFFFITMRKFQPVPLFFSWIIDKQKA